MSRSAIPTVDEIVSSLKRSFIPTIIIEGTDDVFIYRYLKQYIDKNPVSLQACGGRSNLFSIYDRRDEFVNSNVVFVADKDSYRFEGVPESRSDIIFTSGYCIENDIYDGSKISEIIDENDKPNHDQLRDFIGKWFAFEVKRFLDSSGDASLRVAAHVNLIVPLGSDCLCPNFIQNTGYSEPSEEEISSLLPDFDLDVRGKQLFQMLSRFMSLSGRFSSFSDKNLIEVALKQGSNCHLDLLVSKMNNGFKT